MPDSAVLSIKPCLSPVLLVGGGGLHLLSGMAVAACHLPVGVKSLFMASIMLSLIRFGWQYAYRGGKGFISRIELLDGRWRLETGDGATHQAHLIGGYAHPLIVILNFRLDNGRRRSLTLLPDSADAEALRRLRVWLRTSRDGDTPDHP